MIYLFFLFFFFSSRRRHTRSLCDWSSDVCSSDLGAPVPDALVETWQADPAPPARGFGRCPTDAQGRWEIVTRKPSAAGGEAPHVAVAVFARGLLHRLATRIYFADEPSANAADPVLAALGEHERATLLAEPDGRGGY